MTRKMNLNALLLMQPHIMYHCGSIIGRLKERLHIATYLGTRSTWVIFPFIVALGLVVNSMALDNHLIAPQPLNFENNKSVIYGCAEYGDFVHCDRQTSEFESFGIKSKSSTLYNSTDVPSFVPGVYDRALEMHANSLKSITFANTSLNPPIFSVAFWIKAIMPDDETESPPLGNIISQINAGNSAGWEFRSVSNSSDPPSVEFRVYNSQGEFSSPGLVPISADVFSHIVGTFDGSHARIYRNGTLLGEAKFNGSYANNISIPLRLGVTSNNPMLFFWSGNIDDLRLYDKSLTPSEIRVILENNASLTNNLFGHWSFNGEPK